MPAIVEYKNFSLGIRNDDGMVYNLIDNISFTLNEGSAIGVVGESGCGKSMTSLSLIRLLPPSMVVQGGEILYKGENLLAKTEKEMQDLRGREITMIFQEPMTSLNPVKTIEFQISEVLAVHNPKMSKAEIRQRVIEVLDLVGIPNPAARLKQYPHQFSGGMRQRVMIAIAIVSHPTILIADEPTTALDVTIQAQILELMKKIKKSGSLMLTTHNLGVVADTCDDVIVMYAGRIVEQGSVHNIFNNCKHPYTKGLMSSIPTLDYEGDELHTIPGAVPTIFNFEKGCRFAPRCESCMSQCSKEVPPLRNVADNHVVQCWLEFN